MTRPASRLGRALAARMRGFGGDSRGVTALEFALVGVPFFAMILGLLELGIIFLISTSLDNATGDAARTIRTGQLQGGGTASAAGFQKAICSQMGWMSGQCASSLQVDVEPYANFQGTNGQGAPIANGQLNNAGMKFTCGSPGSIVLVRAYFSWPLIAPGFDGALQKLSNGSTVITASAVFRNEPYTPGGTPAC